MALLSATAMAELCQTALSNIISGKISNYTVGDSSFTRHNIESLQKLYLFWKKEASVEANGNSRILRAQINNDDIYPADVEEIVDED